MWETLVWAQVSQGQLWLHDMITKDCEAIAKSGSVLKVGGLVKHIRVELYLWGGKIWSGLSNCKDNFGCKNCFFGMGKSSLDSGIARRNLEYITKARCAQVQAAVYDNKHPEAITLVMRKMEGLKGNKKDEEMTFGAPSHLEKASQIGKSAKIFSVSRPWQMISD